MDADPDRVAPSPPPPPPRRSTRFVIPAIAAGVVALTLALLLWGDAPTSPTATDAITTAAIAPDGDGDGGTVVTTSRATPPTVTTLEGGTTDPTTPGSGTVPDTAPPPWTADLVLVWDAAAEAARAEWADAAGGDHFTYRFTWASAGDSASDFGTLAAGTRTYTRGAPCGATITFEVLAWTASGVELGRDEAAVVSASCPPAVVLPSNLRGQAEATGVRFRWDPGSGYRAAFEVTVSDAGGASTDLGNLGTETSYAVSAYCDTDVAFTLFAFEPGGTAELGRLSTTFATPPCPGTFVTTGARQNVPAGTSGGGVITCPGGSAVIGGGFGAGINVALMPYPGWISRSEVDGSGWAVRLGAPPERALSIFPSILCMAHAETETRAATVTVPSDSLRSIVAECPAGPYWVAVGGGYEVTPYGPKILVSAPDGSRAWRVTAFNENASSVSLRATVICIGLPYADTRIVRSSVTIADGSWGSRELTCPAGWTMMGGGWATPDIVVESAGHRTAAGVTRWEVFGHNQQFAGPAGPAMQLEAVAVCIRFR